MRKLSSALTAVALVVVVGCGGDDDAATTTAADDATTTTTETTTTSESTTTTEAAPAELTSEQIVEGLRAAGLPIGAVQVYDASNDPNELLGRPGQYIGKASFADTRVGTEVDGVEGGGDVEVFDDPAAQSQRVDYLETFADQPPIGGWYQYNTGNAVLRVSFSLTPEQADEYRAAFEALYG